MADTLLINISEGAFSIGWETIILSNEFHDKAPFRSMVMLFDNIVVATTGIKVENTASIAVRTAIIADTITGIGFERSSDVIHSYKVRRFDATYSSKERNVTGEL